MNQYSHALPVATTRTRSMYGSLMLDLSAAVPGVGAMLHYHACPGIKGLAPTLIVFSLIAVTNAITKFFYKIPSTQKEQKAHPNQAAVKSSSMLGLGMLLVAMALAGMTFPNTQYFAKNASASKNMTAMDFYNGEESDSYFGPMPVGADSTTNADSDGMCNPQVYVGGFIVALIVNSITLMMLVYVVYMVATGRGAVLKGEDTPLIVNDKHYQSLR